MSRSTTSTRLLDISRDGDSTTSLSSLCQCLTTLWVKKFFLVSPAPRLLALAPQKRDVNWLSPSARMDGVSSACTWQSKIPPWQPVVPLLGSVWLCHASSLAASHPSSQPRGLSLPWPSHESPKSGQHILYLKCVTKGEDVPQSFACGLAEWAEQDPLCG